jgi:hypothetical protein
MGETNKLKAQGVCQEGNLVVMGKMVREDPNHGEECLERNQTTLEYGT